MKYEGLNPEKLSNEVLAEMPEGARLLESEKERIAFSSKKHAHLDLFTWHCNSRSWVGDWRGDVPSMTYCTTRPKGWWEKTAGYDIETMKLAVKADRETYKEALKAVKPTQGDNGTVRQFATGATRDTATNKPDYDGYLSPYVIEAYGAYMLKHQVQSDGSLRASDNWQKGIPQDVYRKSAWRHFFAFWKNARRGNKEQAKEDALALLFNVMGWLHEQLKPEEK